MFTNRLICFLITLITLGLLAACVAPTAPAPANTPLPAPADTPTVAPAVEATVEPTADLVVVSASPRDPGVSGVARWGTRPVPDAIVELRTGDWRVNPNAVLQSAITDPEGRYLMQNIPSGDYVVCGLFPEGVQERSTCTPVHVEADQDTPGIDVMLLRTVELISPAPEEQVSATPTLRWQSFAEAARYEVFIIDAGTTELLYREFVPDTQFPITTPLQAGRTYNWVVNAVAADGGLLADNDSRFVVEP
jgi:hypothetical protein